MGNNPSTPKSGASASQSSSSHESSRQSFTRKDNQRTFTQSQRAAGNADTTVHRQRNSIPVATTDHPSPAQSLGKTAAMKNPLGTARVKNERSGTRERPSKPIAMPIPTTALPIVSSNSRSYPDSIESSETSGMPDMSFQYTTRPPRLPLPIEEEVHTPGSPIITPADLDAPYLGMSDEKSLVQRGSQLSNSSMEDDEEDDELNVDKLAPTVPVVFEWKRGGERAYVTGTIFQWNRKHRLQQVPGQPGLFRGIVHCRPGTHHVRFIVDGLMQCSPDLPTTVDFGNNLVNYVEVSADDIPKEEEKPAKTEPLADITPNIFDPPGDPGQVEKIPPVIPKVKTKVPETPSYFLTDAPVFLSDLDKPEDSREYRYAARAIEKLPGPPTLPGFMGKPILNAATPLKDDNSVLTMPNHTALNHLATSSIKHSVLAVSGTTRYGKKFVTTIMYKPTGVEG
ncbi:hypothetical protein BJ878DRAFT_434483 [Calycina marina]|uniref:Association with the SNF1 complex (ASC) domain-containing protein n=1 Tax=Calycina marina TaxID=1763456 RepID=A0A9P8CIE7_9HELO|nr:hypothetical protein BJ878DRAFT_434483 [Calycina marina]